MSWDACLTEIRTAAGRDMSDDDIHAMLEDVQLRADRLRRERTDLSNAELLRAAAQEAQAETLMAARIEARNRKLNLIKRVRRRGFYDAAPDPLMGLEAKLVGVNTPFAGSRLSVAAQGVALKRDWVGGMTVELERAGLFRAVRDGVMDREIARELAELNREGGNPGVSGVPHALEAARIIQKYQKASVEALNKEGAWIGSYDGYVARTAHDPDLIRRAGFEAWRDLVERRLDERTFEGVEDRERFLRGVYNALVTGVHLTPDGLQGFKDPAFKGPSNTAKKLSQGRTLHWRDAGAWLDYQQAFAGKTLVENVLRSLDRAAQTTALMREFGTNPRAEFEGDLQALKEKHRDGDTNLVRRLAEAKWLHNRFDEIDGTASMPVNRLAARISAGVRTWNSMSKLGGVVLSAVTDVYAKASELRYQGIGLLQGYQDGLMALTRGRGAGEEREVIDLLRAGLEGMTGDLTARFDATDAVPGMLSKVANSFFRWTGLTYWTDAQRAGAEFVMARHLGTLRDRDWAALPQQTQRILSVFGISDAEWGALRATGWHQAEGRAFLTPDTALRIGDTAVDGVIAPKLADIRDATLSRVEQAVERISRLEERLGRIEADLAKPAPDARTVELAELAMGTAATARYQRTIKTLRQSVRDLRDGRRTATEVGQRLAREIGNLARAERKIQSEGEARVRRALSAVLRDQARRPELEAKVAGIHQDMLRALETIEEAPARLEEEMAKARDGWRSDLALKLHAYYADRGEYAVLAPGARERAMLRRGTRPGTIEGEALRFVGQFKAFPVAVISKLWGREVYGGQGAAARAGGIVHMMVASTVFGYLAMTLKDLAKGRVPRDPTDPATWGAAFVQGGGAGIYGDYLVGSYSRMGRSMLASLAGPTFGQVDDLAELWNRVREGDDTAAQAFRLALSNTPFLNLFYTRIALDYLALYQVQEALNPGFLRRYERRVAKENNQRFFLSPAAAIPTGGGDRFLEGLR